MTDKQTLQTTSSNTNTFNAELISAREVMDTLPMAMAIFEPDGAPVFMNQEGQRILGVTNDDHTKVAQLLTPLKELITKGCDVERGEKLITLDDGTEMTVGFRVTHINYPANKPLPLLIFRDITQMLNDKDVMANIERELSQSRRLASIGTMIAGVAHEMNNPLAGISMSHQLAQKLIEKLKDDPDNDHLKKQLSLLTSEMEKIDTASQKVARLVDSLLTYSKPEEIEVEEIIFDDLLNECVQACKNQPIFHEVTFDIQPYADLTPLNADKFKLEQVFYNLFKNATEATEGIGTLSISWQHTYKDNNTYASSVSNDDETIKEPNTVDIRVTDNGPGMDPSILERIFDPFFSTKGHAGVGLGLSICYRTIEQHGGLLQAESIGGEGTTFIISLPLHLPQSDDDAL